MAPKTATPAPAPAAKKIEVEKKPAATKGKAPENVNRKAKRDEKLKADASTTRATLKKTRTEKKKEYLKRAEGYHKAAVDAEKNLVAQRRKAKAEGAFFVPETPKVYLVTRIRGINNLNPVVRKILQLLRLRQLHNAVFVRVNRATTNMLRKVEPYIAYGYPSRALIRKLIYKRGHGKANRQRLPLINNEIIENNLGKQGLICFEDLINEITTCGAHFKEANNFLWPFKLNPPRGGFIAKRHPYHSRGDWGNREEEINDLVERML